MRAAVERVVACTLRTDALGQRLAWIRRVTVNSLLSHRLDGSVLRLTYRSDAITDLEQIVAEERECCSFLRYSLEPHPAGVRLTIEAPDGDGTDARWLFDQFLPQAQAAASGKACGCAPGACG